MGMFDTVILDRVYACRVCGAGIGSVQTKAFENVLETYRVGDCISHAEDIRVVKESLYCDACQALSAGIVYLAVNRGILAGIAETLTEARGFLESVTLEKMILWYHDMYGKYDRARADSREYRNFIYGVERRFGGDERGEKRLSVMERIWYGSSMRGAASAVDAIAQFRTLKEMEAVLDDLWEKGVDPLPITLEGDAAEGQVCWSVDVRQAEINDRCKLDTTWTVMSKAALKEQGREEDDLPARVLVVDEPFSKDEVSKAVKVKIGLQRRPFGVRVLVDNGLATELG